MTAFASMVDVAREAGVSVSTVSNVINGVRPVSPELKASVTSAMRQLRFRPNALARSLKTQKTYTLGVVVSDITNPFFSSVVRGAEDAASEQGYSTIICNTDENPVDEHLYVELLLQRKVDGLLIVPTGDKDNLQAISESSVPFVFVDRVVHGVEADAVLSDNIGGAAEATRYLLSMGHRRIGLMTGPEALTPSVERAEGFTRTLAEAGIPAEETPVHMGCLQTARAAQVIEGMVKSKPRISAVIATSNTILIGILGRLHSLGISCPEEISIIAFDDPDWMQLLAPPLTTVAQDPYMMGFEATGLLLRKFSRPISRQKNIEVRVGMKLIVRESVLRIAGEG